MNKLHCNIVKDLIPSYLDNICSEESRKAVEEHIATCESCRSHVEMLKNTQLVSGKSGQDELNFMKKVKNYYARKNALGAALLFGLSVMMLPVIAARHPKQENTFYHILFSVLAIGTYLLLSNYRTKPKNHWPGIVSLAASIFGILYASALAAILYNCTHFDSGFWGLELYEMGPVLSNQFILIVVTQLVAFAVCAIDSVSKKYTFGLLPSLNLACCSLSMGFRDILFHMDSASTLLWAICLEAETFLLMAAGILLAEFTLSCVRSYIDKTMGIGL